MARIRAIHPRAPQDEDVASMSMPARLLWAYLPCFADREGRLEDRPLFLKGQVFPADTIDVSALLQEFADRGFVVRYEADGKRIVQIRNWNKYQRPDHHERASALPECPGNAQATPGQTVNDADDDGEMPGQNTNEVEKSAVCPGNAAPVSGIRDPVFTHTGACARSNDSAKKRPNGFDLLTWFGVERAKVFTTALPWNTAMDRDGSAEQFARLLSADDVEDVKPTMRLAFEHIRDGAPNWTSPGMSTPSFAFGAWKSHFTALREELHGRELKTAEPAKSNQNQSQPRFMKTFTRPIQNGGAQ